MKWKIPSIIKVYEALGTIADGRIEVADDNKAKTKTAKVYSSSRSKFYGVTYNPETSAIMANDNGSYWQGYLGYPSIALLFKVGVLDYKQEYGEMLKDISWKDVNTKFKNDFNKTQKYCDELIAEKGVDIKEFHSYAESVLGKISELDLSLLGSKVKPPEGY